MKHYLSVLKKLVEAGVRFKVVGVSGLNFYARSAAETLVTQDFDIFIPRNYINLKKCISVFRKLDYDITSTNRGVKVKDLKSIYKKKQTLQATDRFTLIQFDICQRINGFTYDSLPVKKIKSGRIKIEIGEKRALLESKRLANREKDRLFLAKYNMIQKNRYEKK